MKKFDVPETYRSAVIGRIKDIRKIRDPRKQDFSPAILDLGNVRFILPRHFGFCYGVENAIEISFRALRENPGKRIFLLSQMIHNPAVNEDLLSQGISFIMDTEGNQFVPWDEISPADIVIIPAFGTTVVIQQMLDAKGVETKTYNTTCPFVEKVWKRSGEIGNKGYTIIIHGKYKHEETRATFSHSMENGPALVIRNLDEAKHLARFIRKEGTVEEFNSLFAGKTSPGFDISKDLERLGVVNQTTMLATETQAIADYFKSVMVDVYGERFREHFADTRDTLCYATNDNQQATHAVNGENADLALVVGGYNSSNTAQLVDILSTKMPSYFIGNHEDIESSDVIHHFNYALQQKMTTKGWLPSKRPVSIVLTSGASCPDSMVEAVMYKVLSFVGDYRPIEEAIKSF